MSIMNDHLVRIASASGATTDRSKEAFLSLAKDEDVHFIVGDWLSEMNMTTRAGSKTNSNGTSNEFEMAFVEAIEPALPYLADRDIKVAVNAGASDTAKLHDVILNKVQEAGLHLKIAWVGGDEVIDVVQEAIKSGADFKSLTSGKSAGVINDLGSNVKLKFKQGRQLSEWEYTPIYAQCYLGCWGIVEAFKAGADIVLCGRVADASPVIGCAAYYHGWARENIQQLGHAFVAGHLIECSTYVCGGNFSGFKSVPNNRSIGFPIAEILPNGEFFITKQNNSGGMVTVDTCTAQLLYEIQGPLYYHSDVVAVLDSIKMVQKGRDRVFVSGVGSLEPPPTTKVGITARGGFQAEVHFFLCGLDIEEKAELAERQIRAVLDVSRYHCLKFRTNGRCPQNPKSQDSATVDFRIFAQARNEPDLSPSCFLQPIMNTIMENYPGATFAMDTRQGVPKEYYEYWVALLPQSTINHTCYLPSENLKIPIPPPVKTRDFVYEQTGYETKDPISLSKLLPTTRAPLGHVVHARSGDKGSDSNTGFFVRNEDEWDWLRSLLTIAKLRELLGEDATDKPIFRFELLHLRAVHFLLKDHLDRGVGASSTYDVLGKNVAEYLRSKYVDVPDKFLQRGRI